MTLFFETPSVEGADSSLPAALSFFFLKKRHEPPPTTRRRELANGDASFITQASSLPVLPLRERERGRERKLRYLRSGANRSEERENGEARRETTSNADDTDALGSRRWFFPSSDVAPALASIFFFHFSFNLLPLSPSSLNTLSSPRCLTRRARPPSECSARPRLLLLRCGAKGRERRANENQNDDGLTSKSSLAAAVEWHLFLSLSCSLAHLASFSLISFAISQQQARRQRRRARR